MTRRAKIRFQELFTERRELENRNQKLAQAEHELTVGERFQRLQHVGRSVLYKAFGFPVMGWRLY